MSIELKIKAKHLALEPGIIRKEEEKLKKRIKFLKLKGKATTDLEAKLHSLQIHRRWNVCNEARATHLARQFLAERPYRECENNRRPDRERMYTNLIRPRILAMANKYGTTTYTERDIAKWDMT